MSLIATAVDDPRLATARRLFLSVSVAPGPTPEPDIDNRTFLQSYLDVGVWLRVVAAASQIDILRSKQSSKLQKLSALTVFYQQAGLQAEDTLSNLVAWSVWSHDRNQNLADLLHRTSLRLSQCPSSQCSDNGALAVRERFLHSTKRVEIYAQEYLRSLASMPDSKLPAFFGIPWKRHPSVHSVRPNQRKWWDTLPATVRQLIDVLGGRNSDLLASCHNKMKHGPQMVFADPTDVAGARGHPRALPNGSIEPSIRLLLKGARTQETNEEFDKSARVAPFLYGDSENARRWLYESFLHTGIVMSACGTWIFNFNFPDARRELFPDDPFVGSLFRDQAEYLRRALPEP